MEPIVADVMDRPKTHHPDLKPSNTLVIDGEFLRAQAAEAVATFFAPFNGVVRAASGKRSRRLGRRSKRKAA
jgi:hypothetical protein